MTVGASGASGSAQAQTDSQSRYSHSGAVPNRADSETASMPAERERLSALLGAAPDATVTVDEGGRILIANSQVVQLLGYRPDELVGQSVDQLLPERFRTGHTGHRASFMASPRARPTGTG